MSEAVLIALIGSGGVIAVAVITMVGDVLKHSRRTSKELEGNGRGTMLEMVTDIHRGQGRTDERLDSIEERVDGLESRGVRF